MFLIDNPPISQTSYTPIDKGDYVVPDFGITFMEGQLLNTTFTYEDTFEFTYTQEAKDKGSKSSFVIPLAVNREKAWLDDET